MKCKSQLFSKTSLETCKNGAGCDICVSRFLRYDKFLWKYSRILQDIILAYSIICDIKEIAKSEN